MPDLPEASPPDAPAAETPDAPAAETPDAPAAETPDAPAAETPDAPAPIDAFTPDSPVVAIYGGTVAVIDIEVLDPETAAVDPTLGHGGRMDVSFSQINAVPEESITVATGPFPCYAKRYKRSGRAPAPNIDEGAVTITITNGALIPTCTFSNGGYNCTGTEGTSGATAMAQAGVYTFTPTGGALSTADIGRYLLEPTTGRAFPIVAQAGATATIVSPTDPGAIAAWMTAAGIGPIPPVAGIAPTPPEFLADNSTVDVAKVGGVNIPAFDLGTPIPAGTRWTLSPATTTALAAGILSATGDVSIRCADPGGCGTALGTVVAIDASDGIPMSALDFPDPVDNSANVTCSAVGTNPVVISQSLIQVLRNAAPRKLRIVIARANLGQATKMTLAAGHGFLKYETP